MDELKRQLIEAVAALDAHDAETERDGHMRAWHWHVKRSEERDRLVCAVAGVARVMVTYWNNEAATAPCGAEFAGHVCGLRGAHTTHEDQTTGQRWLVIP